MDGALLGEEPRFRRLPFRFGLGDRPPISVQGQVRAHPELPPILPLVVIKSGRESHVGILFRDLQVQRRLRCGVFREQGHQVRPLGQCQALGRLRRRLGKPREGGKIQSHRPQRFQRDSDRRRQLGLRRDRDALRILEGEPGPIQRQSGLSQFKRGNVTRLHLGREFFDSLVVERLFPLQKPDVLPRAVPFEHGRPHSGPRRPSPRSHPTARGLRQRFRLERAMLPLVRRFDRDRNAGRDEPGDEGNALTGKLGRKDENRVGPLSGCGNRRRRFRRLRTSQGHIGMKVSRHQSQPIRRPAPSPSTCALLFQEGLETGIIQGAVGKRFARLCRHERFGLKPRASPEPGQANRESHQTEEP